ncbi:uncharacterized protein LOC123661902 [Melitaea cinxia]|uniref:uncharacterized protein LOC123661902 n=1 Tax=Melitaea cinxia TaxID=113334 RepID=UPI001E2725F6|nr:uncharacterized protein LOC123661902 [Melitaea cinxia]
MSVENCLRGHKYFLLLQIRQSLLPVVLLTTITLSSSTILPILSIKKLDTDSLLEDQDSDNTLKTNRLTSINPSVFYKILIESSKDNLQKKTHPARLKYSVDDNNQERNFFDGSIDTENNYDDEGFRKEQWHNYPRQLDRLNKNLLLNKHLEKIINIADLGKAKSSDDTRNLYNYLNDDVYGNFDTDIIAEPLFILKIKLAYLNKNIKNDNTDLIPLVSSAYDDDNKIKENDAILGNDDKSVTKVKRKENFNGEDITLLVFFSENLSSDKKSIKKRIFSLWSRLQSLSHRGHELHHRRHLYAFYGLPEDSGGALTAETRATFLRPPGSPLRWG